MIPIYKKFVMNLLEMIHVSIAMSTNVVFFVLLIIYMELFENNCYSKETKHMVRGAHG